MGSGRLFHKEGPTYDKVFCPVLVLRKECLSLAKLFLVSTLRCGANSNISFRYNGQLLWTKTERHCIYALVNSFFSRLSIYRS